MPADRTLLSLDASHAIPTCVLRFEDSRLRRRTLVRPVILTGQTGTHGSDRSGAAAHPSLVLQSWLCGSTKEPSGFLVSHQKPRELSVASANHHSWLGSHVVLAQLWFSGSTKKPSMTSSCCSCHHAVRTWPRWPLDPSNEGYFSSPLLEASTAMTFRAFYSPAPALLSQESVHTTLSITHHTRRWPSTGPQTTHGPQSPPWWVHWQHPHKVKREKGKRKETNKKKLQQVIQSQTKAKRKITWRRQVSDPLGKGNGLTHPRQNYAQAKSANHQTKARKPQRAPPAHMQAPPKPMQLPLDEYMQDTTWNRAVATAQPWPVGPVNTTGQTSQHHRSDQCVTCEQDRHSDRSDRWP
jgi:hypothetical protein